MRREEHQEIVSLLPLSAAGLLDAPEERRVREHIRGCAGCAAHLEELGGIAGALGSLPAAKPSPELVLRTQARVSAELEAAEDRRRGGVLALAGAVFGWISWLAIWGIYRAVTGGLDSVLRFDRSGMGISVGISAAMAMAAAPIAAALLRSRRTERSLV